MPDYIVSDSELQSVANAIKSKAGLASTNLLAFPAGFTSAIGDISAHLSVSYAQTAEVGDVEGGGVVSIPLSNIPEGTCVFGAWNGSNSVGYNLHKVLNQLGYVTVAFIVAPTGAFIINATSEDNTSVQPGGIQSASYNSATGILSSTNAAFCGVYQLYIANAEVGAAS